MKKMLLGMICLLIVPFSLRAANVIQEISVGAFSELDVRTVGNVYLIQGNKESVRIESSKDVSDYIVVKNSGNKLTVTTKGLHNWHGKMDIYITVRNLTNAYFKAVGNIQTKNTLQGKMLELTVNAAGNINFDLHCTQLNAVFSAIGNVSLSGSAASAEIHNSATGNVRAGDFRADVLDVHLSGVGNVTLFAGKEISIDASGTGNITYRGNPVVKHLSKHGTGAVKPE
jgi:hypothetical protein